MQLKPRTTRTIALLTGGIIAATTLFHPAPAQAADKSKKLKYGAVGLGVLGAYLLSKGKTAPGAVAVAGGLYAYKKGRNKQKDDRYSSRTRDGRDYVYNNGSYSGGAYDNGSYSNGRYDNGDYDSNGYGYSSGDDYEYRANAQYRDNRGHGNQGRNGRDRNSGRDRDENCKDSNGRDGRNNRRGDRDNRSSRNRDNRNDRRESYDLSPYLR
jgi:hypothetical protein